MNREYAGKLNEKFTGESVNICGWIKKIRNLGGVIFINVRDISGEVQVIVEPDNPMYKKCQSLGTQYVISIDGLVRKRPDNMINTSMKTGAIEIVAKNVQILNTSPTPPFVVDDNTNAQEELKLRYRFLDLRRPVMQKNIIKRSQLMKAIRDFLYSEDFYEIDTPMLTKSTPEGARDFVVPSRIYRGKFYALPQSPQIYKQVLMSSGFDRYFQIARCFRDEDLRSDRQPEFTQVDLEMSFVDMADILSLTEKLLQYIYMTISGIKLDMPFLRLTYEKAMQEYGSDKPDLRYKNKLIDFTDYFEHSNFRITADIIAKGGKVIGVSTEKILSRAQIEYVTEEIKKEGAAGLLWFKVQDGKLQGQVSKYISGSFENGTYLIVADKMENVYKLAGILRNIVTRNYEKPVRELSILWVINFPLFEKDEQTGLVEPAHHIFTMPTDETIEMLDKDILKVIGRQYDLVINGIEMGSGSIRVHRRDLQEKLLRLIGLSEKRIHENFGFLLEALEYGAPPHGGIALGFDRLLAVMLGLSSIRDVIPFPKTTTAQALFEKAPDNLTERQLKELHLKIIED